MDLPAAGTVLENGVGVAGDATSGPVMNGRHSAESELDEEMTLEMFRACADKGILSTGWVWPEQWYGCGQVSLWAHHVPMVGYRVGVVRTVV